MFTRIGRFLGIVSGPCFRLDRQTLIRTGLVVFVAGGVSACANIERLQTDMARMEGSLGDLRSFQAEQTTKISALETELRSLQGRLDVMEFSQHQKTSSVTTLQDELSTLKRRVPPPPIVPSVALEDDEAAVGRLPAELAEPVGQGLQLVREGNFQKALPFWEDSLYLGSGTQWAPMILFWRGVTLEGMNDSRKALENYHDLVFRFPKDPRTPSVLLRQASVLIRMGDKKTARLTLNKLIADFPRSAEASQAKERLKDIG